ncbi:DNA cytosine methyltransferase [Mycoplasma zalophi]|uniref:DNA cytosine methyltransferase n=1 Tax=Mycoplasma zalophi TaxID=191287 RepID=UPI0021C63B66|nr:DNA cytosine methyltransferase [Mycoplasma zalophi]MCU4116897.1 DNA cytosine methyltransferase [Mycoplasma zalophi]
MFTYSFPCQDLSQQGKQKGILQGTRSGLLLEVQRILENNKNRLPKILLMENVKALASKKFKDAFEKWIVFLESLGYTSSWKILNSVDYGSAQNRERVFMVSILNSKKEFQWPKKINHENTLETIIKFNNDDEFSKFNFLLKKERTNFKETNSKINKSIIKDYTKFNSENYLYLPKGYGATLTASGANSRLKFYFEKENKIRAITDIESFLYMGFSEKDALRIKNTNLINKNKMIFLAGNSISIEVLKSIFTEIIKII